MESWFLFIRFERFFGVKTLVFFNLHGFCFMKIIDKQRCIESFVWCETWFVFPITCFVHEESLICLLKAWKTWFGSSHHMRFQTKTFIRLIKHEETHDAFIHYVGKTCFGSSHHMRVHNKTLRLLIDNWKTYDALIHFLLNIWFVLPITWPFLWKHWYIWLKFPHHIFIRHIDMVDRNICYFV
jgi:hypothetical protein